VLARKTCAQVTAQRMHELTGLRSLAGILATTKQISRPLSLRR
jgi:hypothetical protein